MSLRGSGRIAFVSGSFAVILCRYRRAASLFLGFFRQAIERRGSHVSTAGICFFATARLIEWHLMTRDPIQQAMNAVLTSPCFVCQLSLSYRSVVFSDHRHARFLESIASARRHQVCRSECRSSHPDHFSDQSVPNDSWAR